MNSGVEVRIKDSEATLVISLSHTPAITAALICTVLLTRTIKWDYLSDVNAWIENIMQVGKKPYEWIDKTKNPLDGIKLFEKRDDDGNFYRIAATVKITGRAREVYEIVRNIDSEKIWNPNYKTGEAIEVLNDNNRVIYSVYSSSNPFMSDRDFVIYQADRYLGDSAGTFVVVKKSVVRSKAPAVDGVERADMDPSGFIVVPHKDDPDICVVTVVKQVDIKGYAPVFVESAFATDELVACLQRLRSFFSSIQLAGVGGYFSAWKKLRESSSSISSSK